MLEERHKQDGSGNMQQRLLIMRQPGNGVDRGHRKKEGEVERREERREKRQAPM